MAPQRPTYNPALVPAARRLRREATFPERLLWSRLRRRAFGIDVRRQHPIGAYVVDFYIPGRHLVVELDGRSHDGHGAADTARQAALEALGLRIVRFQNDDVLRDLDGVVAALAALIHPAP